MNGNEKEEEPLIHTSTHPLTSEQIEEFFKATEDGSVERLDRLFNQKINADPNMTRFTESLLMAAIRRNRNDVADYLIDQLAVNVQHAAALREFRLRSRVPVRHRTFTCRDLAYEKGMMELVDLIDLTSNDVKPNIKRYLKTRLQPRLDHIHQAYLKRLEERKHLLFQSNKERESPTVNRIDENHLLPPIIHRPYRSRIQESMECIVPVENKSIDETGKKTFRFSNYTLRFRLAEKPKPKIKTPQQSLPMFSLFATTSMPLFTTNNTHHSRPSVQQRPILPQIAHTENKPSITNSPRQFSSPKRVKQNNIQYTYPSPPNTLYNQSRYFVPVTFKSTAIGLPSDTRLIRD